MANTKQVRSSDWEGGQSEAKHLANELWQGKGGWGPIDGLLLGSSHILVQRIACSSEGMRMGRRYQMKNGCAICTAHQSVARSGCLCGYMGGTSLRC